MIFKYVITFAAFGQIFFVIGTTSPSEDIIAVISVLASNSNELIYKKNKNDGSR